MPGLGLVKKRLTKKKKKAQLRGIPNIYIKPPPHAGSSSDMGKTKQIKRHFFTVRGLTAQNTV